MALRLTARLGAERKALVRAAVSCAREALTYLLEGDADADLFGCDGSNAPGTPGSAPGNADLTVDYSPGAGGDLDTLQLPLDCEF